jgi:hypothetical protein
MILRDRAAERHAQLAEIAREATQRVGGSKPVLRGDERSDLLQRQRLRPDQLGCRDLRVHGRDPQRQRHERDPADPRPWHDPPHEAGQQDSEDGWREPDRQRDHDLERRQVVGCRVTAVIHDDLHDGHDQEAQPDPGARLPPHTRLQQCEPGSRDRPCHHGDGQRRRRRAVDQVRQAAQQGAEGYADQLDNRRRQITHSASCGLQRRPSEEAEPVQMTAAVSLARRGNPTAR